MIDFDVIRAYLADLEDVPAVEPILAGHYKNDVHTLLTEVDRLSARVNELEAESELVDDELEALKDRNRDLEYDNAVLRRERDLALARDLQSYHQQPTAEAYELACKALWKHRAEEERLRKFMQRRTLDGRRTEFEVYQRWKQWGKYND